MLPRLRKRMLRYALIMLIPELPIPSALFIKDTGTSASIARILGFAKHAVGVTRVAGLANVRAFSCLGGRLREAW